MATITKFIDGSWIGRLSKPLAQFEGFWVLAPAPIVLEENTRIRPLWAQALSPRVQNQGVSVEDPEIFDLCIKL